MAPNVNEQILDRLDKILLVLSLQVAADKSVTDAVWTLKLAGLDNKTIAQVLNINTATVRALLSKVRKTKAV
jgi:DNA-binding transcriptional regulator LsrR (DeoR family)